MHLVLSCYYFFLEGRDILFENILELLDVSEYKLLEYQDPELQLLSLSSLHP